VVSVNSAIGVAPHVLSLMHVIRLTEADGSGRAAGTTPGTDAGTSPPTTTGNDMTANVFERDLVLRSGERMHYREAGPPQGRPILMLHGNPGHSYAWADVMKRLADVGRCVAPDLMGFGASEKPTVPPSFYNHAEYIDQFVEGLGLRGVTLFIQDWGGALGFDHAVRHQDNVRAIAFFESILKPYESWETFPQKIDRAKLENGDPQQTKSALARQKFREFRQEPEVGGPGWEQITVGNVFLKVFMGPLLGHPFDPREIPEPEKHPVLGPVLEPYLKPFPTIWSRNPIWRLSSEIPIGGSPADVTATVDHYSRVLAEWDVPKLLIYSDKGPTLKEEHAEWVRQNWKRNLTVHNLDRMPGISVVEGTHFLQQTHPNEIAKLFREWFLKLS
jgi:haloalkane dehalogenase